MIDLETNRGDFGVVFDLVHSAVRQSQSDCLTRFGTRLTYVLGWLWLRIYFPSPNDQRNPAAISGW